MANSRHHALIFASRVLSTFVVLAALACTLATRGHAVPMLQTNSAGKVIGVTGLEVAGSLFDVGFSEGMASFNQAEAALGTPVDFGSEAATTIAGNALRDFLNSGPATPAQMSWGPMDDSIGVDIMIPFGLDQFLFDLIDVAFEVPSGSWIVFRAGNHPRAQPLDAPSLAFGFFTPAVSVDAPPVGLIFVVAVIGLLVLNRRNARVSSGQSSAFT